MADDVVQISDELKAQLKANRLAQYKARIYESQMDLVAYQAVADSVRIDMAQKNLNDLVASYHAVEAM